ncbi:MAG: hypothetical protein PHS62_03270 [Patescibacteria group bacterium]|nr:hypothetical protein [Patescibacteria group bacterium]
MLKKKNNIFIISGPSGSGQDSVIEGLKKYFPLERVVTTTTRPMRPGEKPGQPYYFIALNEFLKRIKEKKFLEYAKEYNGNYYGVTREEMARVKRGGKIGIWKIEYQGVMAAKKLIPGIIAICINAPLKVLIDRIKKRDKASAEYLAARTKYTKEWLKHLGIYDYVVINEQGKLDQTIEKTAKIIKKCLG